MIPTSWKSLPDWMRQVALAVNPIIHGYTWQQLDAEPDSPTEGFTFYDTSAHVVKTWDGSAWRSHW